MDFIESEENLHLLVTPSPFPTPVPTSPFPFLSLPREIRDQVYHYALLRLDTGRAVYPTHIVYVKNLADASTARDLYWGTEHSTRLFRVNRQVSYEALELFYSTFPFRFAQMADVALVDRMMKDTLTPWARGLISKVYFVFNILCTPSSFTAGDEEIRARVVEAVMRLLPNIKEVELTFEFVGVEVPDWQVKGVVDRAVRIAGPLRDMSGLEVKGDESRKAQRAYILREIRGVLGCRRRADGLE